MYFIELILHSGYLGRLRKKSTNLHPPDEKLSWKRSCTFQLGPQMPKHTWLLYRSDPFRVGCYICLRSNVKSKYARMEMQPAQASDLANHSKNKKHLAALQLLQGTVTEQGNQGVADTEEAEANVKYGICSGLDRQVPRMDSWMHCLTGILKRASFEAAKDATACASVGSALLAPEMDSSTTVQRKMLQCLRAPLDEQDLIHMRSAVAASLAIDKGDSYLIVYGRILSKHGPGLYDFLVGIDSDSTPDLNQPDSARKVKEALLRILGRAAPKRGTQKRTGAFLGSDDAIDQKAMTTFCKAVVSITADGGPTEQRAAYECSPLLPELVGNRDAAVVFPNCALISRDRAHRVRSVQKLFFKKLPPVFQTFISQLLTGNRSLAKLLETSDKFGKAFVDKQKEFKQAAEDGIETAAGFAGLIKSLSFADHRFDSRVKPLHRLFRLLGVVLSLLEDIASERGPWSSDDSSFARELLLQLSGDSGYNTIVSAALAADVMMIASPFLRLADESHADFSLSAASAAECLGKLRHLLLDGGIWLPAAGDTLVHAVLKTIKERLIILGSHAAALRWPAPDSLARKKPIAVGREYPGSLCLNSV